MWFLHMGPLEYSSLTQLTQEVTGWPSLSPAAAAAGYELPSPPRMFGGLPLGDPRWIPVRCRSTCARAAGAVARASSPLHNPVRILNRICLLISADDFFLPVTGSRALDFFARFSRPVLTGEYNAQFLKSQWRMLLIAAFVLLQFCFEEIKIQSRVMIQHC
jgi:hypothetical protein